MYRPVQLGRDPGRSGSRAGVCPVGSSKGIYMRITDFCMYRVFIKNCVFFQIYCKSSPAWRRSTHLIWDLSVQSLLLANLFLYNQWQPGPCEGEVAKYCKFLEKMFKEHPVSTEGCLRKIVLYLICCNPSLPFIAARDMHSSKRTSVKSTPVGWGGYRGGALRLGPTPPKILCPRLSWSLSDDDQDSNPMLENLGICFSNNMYFYMSFIFCNNVSPKISNL